MELSEMNLMEVEERLKALEEEVREMTEVADVEKATEEKRALLERKAELVDLEERTKNAELLQTGEVSPEKTVEQRKEMEPIMEEKKVYGVETNEYRSAFYAMIAGNATDEQRAILTAPISVDGNGTDDGAAIAIPKSLDEKIWDNIHTAHPIVADVTTVKSGVVMEVTRHTAITNKTAGKKDAAANAGDQTNTFVKVTLAGKDFEAYCELTYAEAKMSQGALEDYLAQEIADEIGEAVAKDIFATVVSDAGVGQKVTATADMFQDVKDALALATMAGSVTIYAPSAKYYEIVGAVKSGSPFNIGATLGCTVKKDDATANVVVMDPKAYVLNEVQATMIESDKDIKNHKVVVSGYMRAEGTLRKVKAASYIA